MSRIPIIKTGKNVTYHSRVVDLTDPMLHKLEWFFDTADARAKEYLERLHATKNITYQKAYLQCGFHRLETCEKANGIIAELADVGFAIFSTRIAALGLAEGHARKLYFGSADYQKYSSHSPASTAACSTGLQEEGAQKFYCDEPVASSASVSLTQAERIAELSMVLAEGKRDLAKSQKALAA